MWVRFLITNDATNRRFLAGYQSNHLHPFYGYIGNKGAIETAIDLVYQSRQHHRLFSDGQMYSDHLCQARLLLEAPRGAGKTEFVRRLALLLRTPLAEIDGANLVSLNDLVTACQRAWEGHEFVKTQLLGPIMPEVRDGNTIITLPPMTVFIDEVHRIKPAMQDKLLMMADIENGGFLQLGHILVDFRQVCLVIATNCPGNLREAFKSRFEPVKLERPTVQAVATILFNKFSWPRPECLVVARLVPVSRQAISFAKMVEAARVRQGCSVMEGIEIIRQRRQIHRNGLTNRALQILLALAKNDQGLSKTMLLASVEDMEEEEFNSDILPLLVATDERPPLITVARRHMITMDGLKAIEECQGGARRPNILSGSLATSGDDVEDAVPTSNLRSLSISG